MSDIVLMVGGRPYSKWLEAKVTRSIEAVSGCFSFTGAYFPGRLMESPIEVFVDGEKVLTGWVDEVEGQASADSRACTILGRDKAGDLIDCSPKIPEFKKSHIVAIARAICKPFGIKVHAPNSPDVYGAAFELVSGHPGEEAFAFLDRLAKARGVLIWSDGLGGIVIGLPSALGINTVLARGENLRSITVRQDFKQLHSEIRAVSQVAGTDTSWGNAPVATVTEPKVKRFRPITVVTEQATDATKLVSRANAERNIRMGNARRVVVDVVGWRIKPSLPLWPIARSVVVRDEEFNLYDERLVISTVTYRKNHQDGEVTTLEMVPRAALNQLYKSENKSEVW